MIARSGACLALLVAVAVPAAVPAAAFAQDRTALLLRVPTSPEAIGGATGRAQPGVSASSPLGFGPSFRDVFIGAGYQAKTRYGGDDDGTVSAGFGLGNSTTLLGVELVLTSLSTVRTGFGDRMIGSVKIHRVVPYNIGVGVGVEGIKINGDNSEAEESFYVAVSKALLIGQGTYFNAITLNAGLGNGRFRSEADVTADKDGINLFASAGLRIAPALGAIVDWTGQDLNVAASIAPFPKFNLVISPGFADVSGLAGNGVRFTLGAGLSWRF